MSEYQLLGNRYQLEDSLGSGGMAVVYRAQDVMLERKVAVKVLRQDFSNDEDFRERFRQEARAVANLSHPNIVTVHDFGFDPPHLFIVMEYVPGTDLKSMLKRRGRYNVQEALPLMVQVCAGIGYAHRAGLVHCDVKPHNVMIAPDKRVKVTDFGIARALASIHPDEQLEYVWGSPQYFSPEQASGEAPSPASDVYSLGVLMYEMLTGRLPFESDDTAELVRLHRETMPVSPRELNPEINHELEEILLKVLSKEPSARYRTADQFGRVLVTFRQAAMVAAPPEREKPGSVEETIAPPPIPAAEKPPVRRGAERDYLNIDWVVVLLGLLAFLAVGGLIPLWIWVYFVYNPPLR